MTIFMTYFSQMRFIKRWLPKREQSLALVGEKGEQCHPMTAFARLRATSFIVCLSGTGRAPWTTGENPAAFVASVVPQKHDGWQYVWRSLWRYQRDCDLPKEPAVCIFMWIKCAACSGKPVLFPWRCFSKSAQLGHRGRGVSAVLAAVWRHRQ